MKSIKSRFVFYILLIATIPTIAFLVYSLVFVSNGTTETELDAAKTKLIWSSQYLELVNEQLDDILYSLHLKDNLLNQVDNSNIERDEIEDVLKDVLYNNANLIEGVEVYSANSLRKVKFDYEVGFQSNEIDLDNNILLDFTEPAGIRYLQLNDEVVIAHTINDFDSGELLGVVLIHLKTTVPEKLDEIFGGDNKYILYSGDHILFNYSDMDIELLSHVDTEHNGVQQTKSNDTYIWSKHLNRSNLTLVSFVDESIILEYNNSLIRLSISILGISVLVAVPFAILLSYYVSKPITDLVEHMKSSSLEEVIELSKGYEEIIVLEDSYNHMVREIKTLISEKYEQEITNQKSQLKALQAQINPHFLSNTFQLIGGMALSHGVDDIYHATIKMSNLIRYAMKDNSETITLKDEIHHMTDYLEIQKLRFGDNLEFKTDVPIEVEKINIPQLSLQPIIENSFKHGLKKKVGIWKISITCKVDEMIKLYISDNGKGIKEDKLKRINEMLEIKEDLFTNQETHTSIGLVNINSRIKLLYGKDSGLHLSNNKDEGVTVCITIPKGEYIL